MKDLKFRVHSREHSKAIQERLFELGYKWRGSGYEISCESRSFIFADNNCLMGYSDDFAYTKNNHKETTLDELYKMSAPKKIRLNSEYEAVIKNGFIEVGCQNIKFERIEELYNLIKQK